MARTEIVREVARMMQSADEVDPTGGRSRAEWAAVNADGWTVDTNGALGNYVRHEGVVLDAEEFAQACRLAEVAG